MRTHQRTARQRGDKIVMGTVCKRETHRVGAGTNVDCKTCLREMYRLSDEVLLRRGVSREDLPDRATLVERLY